MFFLISMGRSKQCGEVVESMIECGISTPGILIVNGTDQEAEYRSIRLPELWTIEVLPENIGVCGAMAKAFAEHPNEDFYGLVCDDEFVHTPGFDKTLIAAAGRWGISHGNDRYMTEHSEEWIHTYAVFGAELVRAVGWWPLPGIWHCGFDNAWMVIAKEFGLRRYCLDVLTTHKNTWNATAPWDDVYRLSRDRSEPDLNRFKFWRDCEYPELAIKLRQVFR